MTPSRAASVLALMLTACGEPLPQELALPVGSVLTQGLSARYFSDVELKTEVRHGVSEVIDHDWGDDAPYRETPADGFSVRFSGELSARSSEVVKFHLTSAGRARLFVNGTLIVDRWTDHARSEATGVIPLTEGKRYPVVIEYANSFGPAAIKLEWSGLGFARELLPRESLRPVPVGDGLAVELFSGKDFTRLESRYIDPGVAADFAANGANAALQADGFSVRWSGRFAAPRSGEVTFILSAEGAAILRVGDAVLVDLPSGGEGTATIQLEREREVPIVVELSRSAPGGTVRLQWLNADGAREVVPKTVLFSRGFARGPVWKLATLLVRNTDADYIDGFGISRHLTTRFTEAEERGATEVARLVPHYLREWSNGNGDATMDVIAIDDLAITRVSPISGSYWVSADDAEALMDKYAPPGRYDSIFLMWDVDSETEKVPVCCWWGQGRSRSSNDATYASLPNLSDGDWTGPFPSEVFIHEWLHGSAAYYRAERGLPTPDPHDNGVYGYPTADARKSWWAWYAAELGGQLIHPTSRTFAGFTPSVWAAGTPTQPRGAGVVAAPQALRVTSADQNGVVIAWEPSPDADHYRIFRGSAAGRQSYLSYTKNTSFLDANATPGQTFSYVVRAVTAGMVESADSNEVLATP